jgi:hypothetical protein
MSKSKEKGVRKSLPFALTGETKITFLAKGPLVICPPDRWRRVI